MNTERKTFIRKPNRPFPRHSLEETKIIAQAIQDKNAGKPMRRLLVAIELRLNGFKNCWQLAGKLIKSLKGGFFNR